MNAVREELPEPEEFEVEMFTEDDYSDLLDSTYEEVTVGGMSWSASDVLRKMDPTAFRCGFNDYQETETKYKCPHCFNEYDNYDEAKWCCQNEEDELWVCDTCGSSYDNEEDGDSCCFDHNDIDED